MTAREQHPDLIDGLDDLRPGDIMLGPIGGLVPGLFPVGAGQLMLGEIFRAGGLSVRHAGIVVEEDFRAGLHHVSPRIVEAMPSGARERRLTADDWTRRHAYVRLPEDYRGQAADAAAIARAMIGTPYSFASYGALAAWRFGIRPRRLEAWINRRHPVTLDIPSSRARGIRYALPREAICSVLVDQAWTLAGKQVMPHGTRPQVVTPGALAGRLLRLPGTRWGFPA
jgi:hypothetical protein